MDPKLCRRYNDPGHAHALTFSCYRGLPLLSRDRTRLWFIEAIAEARELAKFDLWAYVVMPEHAHVLVCPREAAYDISNILWRIKRPVARKSIAFLRDQAPSWLEKELTASRHDGTSKRHFWQPGGGHDRNVVEEWTATAILEYIHLNPVKRGLVARPKDWEWSSARWYAGLPSQLAIDPTLPRVYEM